MLSGTDISSYQSSIPKGDFTILKATEGLTVNDSHFAAWWKKLEGKLRGAYHFAHTGNPPVAEADHFLRVVRAGGLKPGDILVLDHEARGASAAHDAAWARTWCEHVHASVGYKPVVYTFLSFAQEGRCAGLGNYPLWMADPSRAPGNPRVPAPWSDWVLHQHSEAGGIDRDVFNGSKADWLLLGGQVPAPKPAPTPVEDDMPFGLLADGPGAVTPIALPKGKFKTIAFAADNGLVKLPAVKLRVAVNAGGSAWSVHEVIVDSTKGETVLTFPTPAATCAVSVQREDDGAVPVAWVIA